MVCTRDVVMLILVYAPSSRATHCGDALVPARRSAACGSVWDMGITQAKRVQVEVSQTGAWIGGVLVTIVVVVILAGGTSIWVGGAAPSDLAGWGFLVAWYVLVIASYGIAIRKLSQRRFTLRQAGYVPRVRTRYITIEPQDDTGL